MMVYHHIGRRGETAAEQSHACLQWLVAVAPGADAFALLSAVGAVGPTLSWRAGRSFAGGQRQCWAARGPRTSTARSRRRSQEVRTAPGLGDMVGPSNHGPACPSRSRAAEVR